MTANGYLQLAFYVVVLIALAKPLGAYMARVYEGQPALLNTLVAPVERVLYRVCGIDARARDDAGRSTRVAAMAFNIMGLLVVYALQRLQQGIPLLNPQDLAAVSPDSAFNTAVSFATNTNWQGYGGETTMSYLTQMLGLTVQNFVSAATGMAVLVALIRGFRRASATTIGNFWTDLVRTTLYILLPLSLVLAVVLVSQGVVQTFEPYKTVEPSSPSRTTTPDRCRGPGDQGREGQSRHRAGDREGADDRRGTRRFAGRDQAARHQRRRLLQRQQRASVRESDAPVELSRAARDPRDLGRALLHVRHDGEATRARAGRCWPR